VNTESLNETQAPSLDVAAEIDAACDCFEAEWRAGSRPRIEAYLAAAPERARSGLLPELLRVEIAHRMAQGETILPRDYTPRFPDHAPLIDALLAPPSPAEQPHGQLTYPPGGTMGSAASLPATTSCRYQLAGAQDVAALQKRTGETIGQYRLVGLIGAGGMGAVYRAAHTMLQRTVALKLLKPDLAHNPNAVHRFLKEAQVCVNLIHEHLVTVHEVGRDGDDVYLTMALIEGKNLAEHIGARGPMPPDQAVRIVLDATRALEYAHARGVVHRDIKPQNLLLDKSGKVTLVDLGLARVLEEVPSVAEAGHYRPSHTSACGPDHLTFPGTLLGTPTYMAPEQVQDAHQADARSDIYALGCTLYYLLAGQHAFRGQTARDTLANHLAGRCMPLREHLPTVPRPIERVVETMLALRPRDRFQTCSEVVKALMRCAAGLKASQVRAGCQSAGVPRLPGYEFWAFSEPNGHHNEHFHEFLSRPDGTLVLLVGEVSRKFAGMAGGVAAFMADVRRAVASPFTIEEALAQLNRAAFVNRRFGYQVALAMLDPTTHRFTIGNAGYTAPLFRHASGTLEEPATRNVTGSQSNGQPLGLAQDYRGEALTMALAPGDQIVLFTEHIKRAMLPESVNIRDQLRTKLTPLRGTAEEVGRALLRDLQALFAGYKKWDAITLVVVGRGIIQES
jgi:serine/threonine protein kinase